MASSIRIISASAGTGKTTRLVEELRRSIAAKESRPESIVAVTFTNKAAAELVERARQALLRDGQSEAANRLLEARVGTIHSVCGRLVTERALHLGLSPCLSVLDERGALMAMNRAMSSTMTCEDHQAIEELTARMPALNVSFEVQRVVQLARVNRIDPDLFGQCASRSIAELQPLFGEPAAPDEECDARLADALRGLIERPELKQDHTKKTQKALARARKVLAALERGQAPAWLDWVAMSKLDVSKKIEALAEPVREAGALHDVHPRLLRDLERTTRLVFDLAARTSRAYDEWKRLRGVLDFVDQEVLALSLIEDKEVAACLVDEIDLLLVDEFQDTSPLQLELFLRLARIAGRTVWVGDPKQAIFGFRGTDPSLMDAAVDGLLEPSDPDLVESALSGLGTSAEVLDVSFRSRPELVHLTSDLFARVFSTHSMREETVRLEPRRPDEPESLGPIAEVWPLPSKQNREASAASLAAIVEALLVDEDVRVRDPVGGEARRVQPRDIAILCRTNADCQAVAAALAGQGRPAVLARTGLLDTLEARMVLALLALYLDPTDRLASATLERIVEEDGDAWLQHLLEGEDAQHPAVARVAALGRSQRHLGLLSVVDGVLSEVDALGQVGRFAEGSQRRSNLDAFRNLAAAYREHAGAPGGTPTVAGFLQHLEEMRRPPYGQPRTDATAVNEGGEAVTVTTWHRAKGLEWPIAVLCGLETHRSPDPFGVDVVSDSTAIDLDAPLAGRWVRFWPLPYWGVQKGTPLRARLEDCRAAQTVANRAKREALRLLYVGWTRARDRIVLAGATGKWSDGILGLVRDVDPDILPVPTGPSVVWAGRTIRVRLRSPQPEPISPPEPAQVNVYDVPGPQAHPPARVAPSSLERSGGAGAPQRIHPRLPLRRGTDMEALGSAIHAFLATDDPAMPDPERAQTAEALLRRWTDSMPVEPRRLVSCSAALHEWVAETWPGALIHREAPLLHRSPDGTVMYGFADWVVETKDVCALVDHKSFPGGERASLKHAVTFAGQLSAYAEALRRATGKPVVGSFIHLPMAGLVVPIALK